MSLPAARTPLLPVRLPPEPDELFSSWFARLAVAHGLKTSTLSHLFLGNHSSLNLVDVDRISGLPLLRACADATGQDASTLLEEHSLFGFVGKLFPKINLKATTGWLLPRGVHTAPRPELQYCPLCLRQAPAYFRRIWRLSLFTVCPTHGVELRYRCPKCASFIQPMRSQRKCDDGSTFRCWNCKHDLTDASITRVPAEDMWFANDFLSILRSGVSSRLGPRGTSAADFFATLGTVCARLLARTRLLKNWQNLAAASVGVSALPVFGSGRGGTMFDNLSDPGQRRLVLRTAGWLLDSWPDRFVGVTRAAGVQSHLLTARGFASPEWFQSALSKKTPIIPPKPLTPIRIRIEKVREILLANRSLWGPSRLDRLIRYVRMAGLYPPETDTCAIATVIQTQIVKLRKEGGGCDHRTPTLQVERDSITWRRLVSLAQPILRQRNFRSGEVRHTILLLCEGRYLSAYDLAELFQRNQIALVRYHLTPMVRSGELEAKVPKGKNRRGFVHPRQAYRTVTVAGGNGGSTTPGFRVDDLAQSSSNSY